MHSGDAADPRPVRGRFGKVFGIAMGIAGGLMNSFVPETLVHVKPANASNEDAQAVKAKLKPIGELGSLF